jgi:Mn-dependent DtxR family transcriptional regulator
MPRRGRRQETPRSEDYLEAVYHLIHDKGYAATADISDRLGVTPPTVSIMVGKLAAKGYLLHEPYRGMTLTETGEMIARSVVRRHEIISEFLSMIGVEEKVAYEDTEGIEHHLQPITIYRIEKLIEFLRKNPAYLAEIKEYTSR